MEAEASAATVNGTCPDAGCSVSCAVGAVHSKAGPASAAVVPSGTPTAAGTSTVAATLTDAAGATVTKNLSLTINVPTISSVTLANSGTTQGKLEKGDTIIDGGNSYYVDDIRRAKELAPKRIHYVDVGTSGGVWGSRAGTA